MTRPPETSHNGCVGAVCTMPEAPSSGRHKRAAPATHKPAVVRPRIADPVIAEFAVVTFVFH